MIKIQGREIKNVADRKVALVRTYKGDIDRTNSGVVAGYPLSFITVGVTLTVIDTKENIKNLQSVILSTDTVKLQCDFNEVEFLGDFSVTSQEVTDLRDKDERKESITITFVNDNEKITKPDNTKFKVIAGASTYTAYFAQIMNVNSSWKLDGYSLAGKLLVLGDYTLEVA